MTEFNKSVVPLRRVKRVQFGILGPDEIVSWIQRDNLKSFFKVTFETHSIPFMPGSNISVPIN